MAVEPAKVVPVKVARQSTVSTTSLTGNTEDREPKRRRRIHPLGSTELVRISSTTSIKSVTISEGIPEAIEYDDPIFGELKQNRNSINPCCCFFCRGHCYLSEWCKIIAVFEIVVCTAGIIISAVILSIGEESQKQVRKTIENHVPLHPVSITALNHTFVVCLITYITMLIGSCFLILAAIAIGRDEEQKSLLYHSRGWMNITFIKSCCWVYPSTTLLCTLGQIWSFAFLYSEGFLITFGFFLELYISMCSVGLFTQVRISAPPSVERFPLHLGIPASQVRGVLKTSHATQTPFEKKESSPSPIPVIP